MLVIHHPFSLFLDAAGDDIHTGVFTEEGKEVVLQTWRSFPLLVRKEDIDACSPPTSTSTSSST